MSAECQHMECRALRGDWDEGMARTSALGNIPPCLDHSVSILTVEADPCPHDAWTGAEGPLATLGRVPTRWSCDGCGVVAEERPVCLSCARDTYPGQPLEQSFPAIARVCHVCGMTTLLGYAVPKGSRS